MMGKTSHLISWQKKTFSHQGETFPLLILGATSWFSELVAAELTSSVVIWNSGIPSTQPLIRKLFPSSPGRCWRLPAVSSIKFPSYTLWLGWNHESCLANEKNFYSPHLMHSVCWHCTAYHECCKKKIFLNLFHVKKFWWAGFVIGVYPKIHPAYFLDGLW